MERDSSEAEAAQVEGETASGSEAPSAFRVPTFRRAYWLVIPAMAVAAYASVLRIGFLADDFIIYLSARHVRFGLDTILPTPWFFYRPVGWLLTWALGVPVWGTNPVPYHIIGLILHGLAALGLGLWLAELTTRKWLGLLAGCLFAVFPLHIEAVGWLAAQWDLWAAMFVFVSLWLFTVWWRRPRRSLYGLSLVCYFLGVFSKESVLTWLPVLALSAWAITPRFDLPRVRRLFLALIPFAGVLALNVGLRLAAWGRLGGYPDTRSPVDTPYFDTLTGYLRFLLAPLNPAMFGGFTQQIASLVVGILLFVGLIWYGHAWRRLLFLVGAWILLSLIPVFNLGMRFADMQNNRFTYLASAGYCVLLAVLLADLLTRSGRFRRVTVVLAGLLLLAGVSVSWVQLQPWHTATVQMQDLGDELARLIPPRSTSRVMLWNIENLPDNYKGAYLLRMVLGEMRSITVGDYPIIQRAGQADKIDVASGDEDNFALRFFYSQGAERFHVSYAAGITSDPAPPSPQQLGDSASVWDFSSCSPGAVGAWQVAGGKTDCLPGQGITFTQASNDIQLVGPQLSVDPQATGARFVRLRAAVSYPTGQSAKAVSQWFWQQPGQDWNPQHSTSAHVRSDGKTQVYWTFLPASDLQGAITRLRFDPTNESVTPTVRWLAVDVVK